MLLIYGLALAQMAIFVVVTYVIARVFGLAPRVIAFGSPPVLRVRRGKPEIRVGPLPTASVELAGERVDEGQRVIYANLARAKRVAIVVAPWIAVLGLAVACIGVEPALRSFVRGFGQVLVTADLTPLVRTLIAIADDAPVVATGILMAKLAAANLLPFGGLAGGMLITQVVTPPARETPKPVMAFMLATMIAWMLWTLGRLVYVAVQLMGD